MRRVEAKYCVCRSGGTGMAFSHPCTSAWSVFATLKRCATPILSSGGRFLEKCRRSKLRLYLSVCWKSRFLPAEANSERHPLTGPSFCTKRCESLKARFVGYPEIIQKGLRGINSDVPQADLNEAALRR